MAPARASKPGDPSTQKGRLRIARMGASMSGDELARAVGLSIGQQIYDFEDEAKPKRLPRSDVTARIAAVTGRRLDWLLNGGEEGAPPTTAERIAGVALVVGEPQRRALLALALHYLSERDDFEDALGAEGLVRLDEGSARSPEIQALEPEQRQSAPTPSVPAKRPRRERRE